MDLRLSGQAAQAAQRPATAAVTSTRRRREPASSRPSTAGSSGTATPDSTPRRPKNAQRAIPSLARVEPKNTSSLLLWDDTPMPPMVVAAPLGGNKRPSTSTLEMLHYDETGARATPRSMAPPARERPPAAATDHLLSYPDDGREIEHARQARTSAPRHQVNNILEYKDDGTAPPGPPPKLRKPREERTAPPFATLHTQPTAAKPSLARKQQDSQPPPFATLEHLKVC